MTRPGLRWGFRSVRDVLTFAIGTGALAWEYTHGGRMEFMLFWALVAGLPAFARADETVRKHARNGT